MKKWLSIALAAAFAAGLAGCGSKKQVIIFHADALTVPMNQIIAAYQRLHPDVEIHAEAKGSVLCAQTARQRDCDILMVADARIIEQMQPQYAEWNAIFTTNEMVIAYSQKSKHAAEINEQNWYEVLTRPGVVFGHSNPEHDPCGYWTLIMWKLADLHYGPMADGRIISETLAAARTPESIKSDTHIMLNLVDSSAGMDYCFVYKNQAVEQNLKIVELPKEINLSDPDLGDFYGRASLPEPINRTGAPIAFSLTLLKKAREPEEAVKFLSYMLGPDGRKVLRGNKAMASFNIVHPPIVDHPNKVPAALKAVMFDEK